MKKKIGTIAAIVGVIDLFVWIFLLVSGNMFVGGSMNPLAKIVFILWFVCVAIAVLCLAGDIMRFLGKSFAAGFNDTKTNAFCIHCGKAIDSSVTFCPHCGQKQN